jgi:hypothetical protein
MHIEDLNLLKFLLEKTSPGPWVYDDTHGQRIFARGGPPGQIIVANSAFNTNYDDFIFIVHARNVLAEFFKI